jgi:sec-independent protein translocase protein TatA
MYSSILLFGVGAPEIVLIVLVVLLLFGGKKIPELMKGLGSGIREFNKAKNDVTDQIREGMKETPKVESIDDKKPE